MASSYESLLQWLRNRGDLDLLDWTWKGMIASGLALILLSEVIKLRIPYGRYGKSALACNMYLSARKAWMLQELPSVVVPLFLLLNIGGAQLIGGLVNPNIILVGMFLLHYVQRLVGVAPMSCQHNSSYISLGCYQSLDWTNIIMVTDYIITAHVL